MTKDRKSSTLTGVSDRRVDTLARRVIAAMRERPPGELRDRIDAATVWLLDEVVSARVFVIEDTRRAMLARDLTPAQIIDHCISAAARELGRRWETDEATFATVSLGSARLYGLCKALTVSWESSQSVDRRASVLVAVCDREDHLIGPVVLTDQLRRAGYSVRLLPRAAPAALIAALRAEPFFTLLISCSGLAALDTVAETVSELKSKADAPLRIVLGGPVIDHADDLLERTGVDLVTNDIAKAMTWSAAKEGTPAHLAVSE